MNTAALPGSPDAPRPRKGPLAWLIASQTLVALSLLPWFVVAAFGVMTFDAGWPTDPAVWIVLLLVYGYPVYTLALAVASWSAYRRGKVRRAMVLTSILLVPALAMIWAVLWAASPPS